MKNIKIILIAVSILLLFGLLVNFIKEDSLEDISKAEKLRQIKDEKGKNFLKSNNGVFSKDSSPYKRKGPSVADKFFKK